MNYNSRNNASPFQKTAGVVLVVMIVLGIIGLLVYMFVSKGCSSDTLTGPKCGWVITPKMTSTSATAGNPVSAKSTLDCANICAADTSNCQAAVFDSSANLCYKKPKLDNMTSNVYMSVLTPVGFDLTKLK